MSLVALKDVDKGVWKRFKSESASLGLKMGEFFEQLVKEHFQKKKQGAKVWDEILSGKALLSCDEAKQLRKTSKEFREGFSFR